MKKITFFLFFMVGVECFSSIRVERVEPLCWWQDMRHPLTLMLYGENLSEAAIEVQEMVGGRVKKGQYSGLVVKGQHNAESVNYLFVEMEVKAAGTYRITLSKGAERTSFDYVIYERRTDSRLRKGFTPADVIYLLMPDRFVDGDKTNNSTAKTVEKCDKKNVHGRFGGDIAGIVQSLDYITSLGATAIWPTPLLLDNEPKFSYHGYACADYYQIDPRMGTNESYKAMVQAAHAKGLKVIMDMVPNHCGISHWWMKDLPFKNWVNDRNKYGLTNNAFSANFDIHASKYDRDVNNRGWFDKSMPDMNLRNKDLLIYFIQMAIWWIEYADLDGLRVDTYPYLEKQQGAKWCKAICEEYPNFNIVGECWTRPASNVAYWQKGVKNKDGFKSELPTVMDFPVEEAIRKALEEDGEAWGSGLVRVYDAIAQDYLYADVNRLLIFASNHDMDRLADIVKDNDYRRVKLALTLVATLRGIPQLYAGDEYAVRSADMKIGHSALRRPLANPDSLTEEQQNVLNYHKKLFLFRKNEPILHYGQMMHFLSRDNTYAFFRYTDKGAIFVFINAAAEERIVPTSHYNELAKKYKVAAKDVFTGKVYNFQKDEIRVPPLSSLILKLEK